MAAQNEDKLLSFLKENVDTLKLNNSAAIDIFYGKIKGKIDYNDLITLNESDIRARLKACRLRASSCSRFVKVLRNMEGTQIYKEQQKSSNTISKEDQKAMEIMMQEINKINSILTDINNELNTRTESAQRNRKTILDNFKSIRDKLDEREKYLLSEFETKNEKIIEKLQSEQDKFQQYKDKLDTCYSQNQSLLEDTSIDKGKKKTKIVSSSQNVMKNGDSVNPDQYTLEINDIHLKFTENEAIITAIQNYGQIEERGATENILPSPLQDDAKLSAHKYYIIIILL